MEFALSTSGKAAAVALAVSASLSPYVSAPPAHPKVTVFAGIKSGNTSSVGGIVVCRHVVESPGQAYFWTDRWQSGERAADEDLRSGRSKTFNSAEEAITWLFGDEA